MTDQTKALAVQDEVALTNFGARAQARELGERLRLTMPNAQAFTDKEALAVAQIALAHDLDPFNGEVWGLKNAEGKWYGVMVGIKGLRKSANRQAVRESTTYWFEYRKADPKQYGQGADATVFEAILRDTVRVQAWSKAVHSLTSVGVPYLEAVQMLGPAPFVLGVGIATSGEKSKMRTDARAKKRAEADALKQRFDVEFAGATQAQDDIDEGDFMEVPNTEIKIGAKGFEKIATEDIDPDEILEILGYDPDPSERVSRETQPVALEQEIPAMTLKMAENVVNDKGVRYMDMPDEELVKAVQYLQQSIRTTTDYDRRVDQQFRLSAVNAIQLARKPTA